MEGESYTGVVEDDLMKEVTDILVQAYVGIRHESLTPHHVKCRQLCTEFIARPVRKSLTILILHHFQPQRSLPPLLLSFSCQAIHVDQFSAFWVSTV